MDKSAKPVFRSKASILLRETWRKAYKRGLDGLQLVITFRTESQAHKCRMDLYKAVQPEKQGRGEDVELIRAAQGTEIVLGEARNQLIMRPRGQNDIFAALQDATGLQLETIEDPMFAADVKMSKGLLAELTIFEGDTPAPTPTALAPATGMASAFGARHSLPTAPPLETVTPPGQPPLVRGKEGFVEKKADIDDAAEMNRLIYERNRKERLEREAAEAANGKVAP